MELYWHGSRPNLLASLRGDHTEIHLLHFLLLLLPSTRHSSQTRHPKTQLRYDPLCSGARNPKSFDDSTLTKIPSRPKFPKNRLNLRKPQPPDELSSHSNCHNTQTTDVMPAKRLPELPSLNYVRHVIVGTAMSKSRFRHMRETHNPQIRPPPWLPTTQVIATHIKHKSKCKNELKRELRIKSSENFFFFLCYLYIYIYSSTNSHIYFLCLSLDSVRCPVTATGGSNTEDHSFMVHEYLPPDAHN